LRLILPLLLAFQGFRRNFVSLEHIGHIAANLEPFV
jgi:hypothetical protein